MSFFLTINVFAYTPPTSKKDFRQLPIEDADKITLKPIKTNKKA